MPTVARTPKIALTGIALVLMLIWGCKEVPTSILLRIEAPEELSRPDELQLTVFSESGPVVSAQRLPPCAEGPSPTCLDREVVLPEEVVLYPPPEASAEHRILVRSFSGGAVAGEGTTTVAVVQGTQVSALVTLQAGALPDRDKDGVPDEIDSCPDLPNPAQGPCGGGDGGTGGDAGPDASPDVGTVDLRRDSPVTPEDHSVAEQGPPPCTCPLGCKPNTSTCRALVPANGFVVPLAYPSIPAITFDLAIDTTTCMLEGIFKGQIQTSSSGSKACVFSVTKLEIGPNATLSATGALPLVLLARDAVTIDGLVDVGAHADVPGPGGAMGGVPLPNGTGTKGNGPGGGMVCNCWLSGADDCGGGGAGYANAGGKGGPDIGGSTCTQESLGGPAYGKKELVPLQGGSGGASGDQVAGEAPGGAGGAGGGALQISCQGTIQIDGAISAGGGGGLTGAVATGYIGKIGAGGGGSGGSVLLEGAVIKGSGIVAANGGGGGGTGNHATGACYGQGSPGEDGKPGLQPAKGGQGSAVGCGDGGDGGFGSTPPGDGGEAAGGGGAAGILRLNWYMHGSTPPVGVSGSASTGEVTVQ